MQHLKKRRATFRVPKTHAACLLFGHQWETTIAQGLLACTRCCLTASCPVCIPTLPEAHIRQVPCSQHRMLLAYQHPKGGVYR